MSALVLPGLREEGASWYNQAAKAMNEGREANGVSKLLRDVCSLGDLRADRRAGAGVCAGGSAARGLRGEPGALQSDRIRPGKVGAAGEGGGHEVRLLHRQAPRRLLHVGHKDHRLQRHAHSLWAGRAQNAGRGLPKARHAAVDLLFEPRLALRMRLQSRLQSPVEGAARP